jgi:hypothetical protein
MDSRASASPHVVLLTLVLFVISLRLDMFAVLATLRMRGLPARERLRVSLVCRA